MGKKGQYKNNNTMFMELANIEKGTKEYIELRNQILVANMGLIYDYLLKHKRILPRDYCDWDDFVQESSITLMKAIERYDASQGKFSSYAKWWIFQATMRCLNDNHIIHIPDNMFDEIRKAQRNSEEITDARKELYKHIINILEIISLDEVYEDGLCGENAYLNDICVEDMFLYGMRGEETKEYDDISEKVQKCIETSLSEREKTIIKKYYYEQKTHKQIASELCITETRVGQIIQKALFKLRKYRNIFEEYIN